MTTLTEEVIEKMSKDELRTAAKARGIQFSKLSLFQVREALKSTPEEIDMAAAKKKSGSKKTVAKKAGKKTGDGPSKMEIACDLLSKNKALPRKDVLKLFQDKAGLTKAGSATYYSLCKKKLGIK